MPFNKMFKKIIAIALIFIISANSFAAVVSDNDGSAFITKAEFDSLKNNFQSQIDQYNISIDNKIDGAIAAYLAGIKTASLVQKNPIFISIYGTSPTFHRGDNYNATQHDTTNNVVWGSYNLTLVRFNLIKQNNYNGAALIADRWQLPNSRFKLLHKLNYDTLNNEWIIDSVAEDANVAWKWVSYSSNYNIDSGSNSYVYWAWYSDAWYTEISPVSSNVSLGKRGTTYQCYSSPISNNRSFDEINVSTRPSWADSGWGQGIGCSKGLWSEVDGSTWSNNIMHLWCTNDSNAIERKFDLSYDHEHLLRVTSISTAKMTTETTVYDVRGNYADPIYVKPNFNWIDVYGIGIRGAYGNSDSNHQSRTCLYPDDVKYVIPKSSGLNENIKLSLWEAPLFDRVAGDASELSFDITLSNEAGYSDAMLYFSKKTWKNANAKPNDGDILKLYNNDSNVPQDSISLRKGSTTNIKIKDIENGDLLYFSIVPPNGEKAKIDSVENLFYKY